MKLTPSQRRALEIVRDHGPDIWPREFAQLMWPDDGTVNAAGHARWKHEGSWQGMAYGRSMWLKAGQMLADLRRRGLLSGGWREAGIVRGYQWRLTALAEESLRQP